MFVDQTLSLLPGVTVANRTNPSQDTRISVRGFGARSQFGARSIRILRDGMPLTLPDGQTPIDYLDLESVGRVEVIRGAAAGALRQRVGRRDRSALGTAARLRRSRRRRARGAAARVFVDTRGCSAANAGAHRLRREHRPDDERRLSRLRATASHERVRPLHRAVRKHSTGLHRHGTGHAGRAQPRRADARPGGQRARIRRTRTSVLKKARKAVHQVQLGVSARRPIAGDGELIGQVYGGTRSLYNPLTFAVVRVDRHQQGAGARLTLPWRIDSVENRFSVGVDAQWLSDARKNWANCNGVARRDRDVPDAPGREGRLCARPARTRVERRSVRARRGGARAVPRDRRRARRPGALRARDHYLGDGRDDSGDPNHERREPDVRRRVARLAAPFAVRERRIGVRDADDDGARQSGRRDGGSQSRSQAAVLDDVRGRREGAGSAACSTTRRCSTPKCATS